MENGISRPLDGAFEDLRRERRHRSVIRPKKKSQTFVVDRKLLKLILSIAIILCALTLKAVYPSGAEKVREVIMPGIARDSNYRETFSAIGRALSGEEPILETIKNVFGVQKADVKISVDEGAEGAGEAEKTVDGETREPAEINDDKTTESGEAPALSFMPGAEILPFSGSRSSPEAIAAFAVSGTYTEPEVEDHDEEQRTLEIAGEIVPVFDEIVFDLPEEDLADDTEAEEFRIPPPDKISYDFVPVAFATQTPLYGTITSPFGYRTDPLTGNTGFHSGLDIGGNTGDTIVCFADGTVEAVGVSTVYGNYVRVAHKDGFVSFYGHCSKILVKKGHNTKKGAKVATVGSTGRSTGPHLHFEVRHNGYIIDASYYVSPQKKLT